MTLHPNETPEPLAVVAWRKHLSGTEWKVADYVLLDSEELVRLSDVEKMIESIDSCIHLLAKALKKQKLLPYERSDAAIREALKRLQRKVRPVDPMRSASSRYVAMKARCCNPNSTGYANYGARGITVCDRWLESFSNFFEDMGPCPEGMSLERVDNDGPYSPENCRWATVADQRTNQRRCVFLEHNGVRMTVEEWARQIGRHPATLRNRIRAGWRIEDVLDPKKQLRGGRSAPRPRATNDITQTGVRP